jgi:two-component system NarL family sensor kinase
MVKASAGLWSPRRTRFTALAVTASVLIVIGQLLTPDDAPGGPVALTAAIAVSFTVLGGLVLIGVPAHPMGRLMMAAGVTGFVAAVSVSWTMWLPAAWLSKWSHWPVFGLILLALLVFPDGRLPSRRWWPVAVLLVAMIVLGTAGLAVAATDHPRTLLTQDTELTPRAQLFMGLVKVSVAIGFAGALGVIAALGVRWRRADGDTRMQLACLFPAGILLVTGIVLDAQNVAGSWLIVVIAVPLGMCVAVLRYHLYELDTVINRLTTWLLMTVLVVATFVGVVTLLRDTVLGESRAALAATGLVAVGIHPLYQRVQSGVNHLVYGDRDDPYEVIGRLGELLGGTVDPGAVLPKLTSTITRSLQVPYVAVELETPEGPALYAVHGRVAAVVESFDMMAHSERLGRLIVGRRSPGAQFSRRERHLLQDVALHAAVAAEATRLTRDLQGSRERLVLAREEERRRLRRELHDGLGPALTGMSMQVHAARNLLDHTPLRVGPILTTLVDDLQLCRSELRRLVDELRPPDLDHGLTESLRAECRRFTGPGFTVELSTDGDLEDLPAAVEVAVYRIVAEALTNVVRHAQATACRVTVHRLDAALVLDIVDDGVGISSQERTGVGRTSMRERAAELSGECVIGPAEPRGTAITVRLPFRTAAIPSQNSTPPDRGATERSATVNIPVG